uniref:Uncharacterized protein n=1 Tax=Globodera pallida TaxID=36090 RepID=A0A183C7B0_GLOPA
MFAENGGCEGSEVHEVAGEREDAMQKAKQP